MVFDRRGINRGACQVGECTCTEFELGESNACEYCGDPPAKHSVLQSRPTDSQPMQAMVTQDQSCNSCSISSTKRKEAWKDKRLGWIKDPKRQTGIYNSIIEQFYNSYWPYYPHVYQFRRAFIMEWKRQWDVTSELYFIEHEYRAFTNVNNSASPAVFLSTNYKAEARRHHVARVTQEMEKLNSLKLKVLSVKEEVLKHDSSLFLSTGKLKAGRSCHHKFNSNVITKCIDFIQRLTRTDDQLKAARQTATDTCGTSSFPYAKRRKMKDYGNKWKTNKRRKTSMEVRAKGLFCDLGVEIMGDSYHLEMGVYQIDSQLSKKLKKFCVDEYSKQALLRLYRCGCFRDQALTDVQCYIMEIGWVEDV